MTTGALRGAGDTKTPMLANLVAYWFIGIPLGYYFGDLKVFIDQASLLYLEGAEVDYVETMEGSGFKFSNPQVKSTCGCGSSFSV